MFGLSLTSTTKMPNFRLTDRQIQAISAYIWQTSFSDAPLLLPAAFHRVDAHSEHGILRVKLYRYQ